MLRIPALATRRNACIRRLQGCGRWQLCDLGGLPPKRQDAFRLVQDRPLRDHSSQTRPPLGLALTNKQFFSFFAIPNSGLEPWNRWAYSVELQKAAGMAGVLYYMVYKYAFYGFGMPVTKLYLMIIAVFSLSGLALVSGMFKLDVEPLAAGSVPGHRENQSPCTCSMWR